MDFAEELKSQIEQNVAILRSGIEVGRTESRVEIEQVREALCVVRSVLREVVMAYDAHPQDCKLSHAMSRALYEARKYV